MRLPLLLAIPLLSLLTSISNVGAADTLSFAHSSGKATALSVSEAEKQGIASMFTLIGPDGKERQYRGVPLPKMLDLAYGTAWKSSEIVLFTCLDGYQPFVPVSLVLSAKPTVVFQEDKPGAFTRFNAHGHDVNPGPFMLLWQASRAELDAQPLMTKAWQLASLELATFKKKFPFAAPPEKASAQAKAGFLQFQTYCIKCHKVNGSGGDVGPELAKPINVTTYFKEEYLRKFIEDPESVRKGAKMPKIFGQTSGDKEAIDAIISYLGALAGIP